MTDDNNNSDELWLDPSEIQQMSHIAREMNYCFEGCSGAMPLQAIAALISGLTYANGEDLDANLRFVAKVARHCFDRIGPQAE